MNEFRESSPNEQDRVRSTTDGFVDQAWSPELIGAELPITKTTANIFALAFQQLMFPIGAALLGAGIIFVTGLFAGILLAPAWSFSVENDMPVWARLGAVLVGVLVFSNLGKIIWASPIFFGMLYAIPNVIASYVKETLVDRVIAIFGERHYASYREILVRLICGSIFLMCAHVVLMQFPSLPGPVRVLPPSSVDILEQRAASDQLPVSRMLGLPAGQPREQAMDQKELSPKQGDAREQAPNENPAITTSNYQWHSFQDYVRTHPHRESRVKNTNLAQGLKPQHEAYIDPNFNVTKPRWKEFWYFFQLLLVCTFTAVFVVQAGAQLFCAFGVFIRRMGETPGVLRSVLPAGSETLLTLAHISDLHIGDSDQSTVLGGGSGTNEMFRALSRELKEQAATLDFILATGDITDSGTALEWHQMLESTPPEVWKRLLIVPGNHDLNVPDRRAWYRVEPTHLIGRKVRLVRFMAALDRVQGDKVLVAGQGTELLSLRDRLAPVRAGLLEFATSLRAVEVHDPGEIWKTIFPMVHVHEESKTCIYILDSNDVGRSLIDNAFGAVAPAQLKRLASMLQRFASYNSIVALHHHVALPPDLSSEEAVSRVSERFMVLRNSAQLVSLFKQRRNSIVFHGHRHVGYRGRLQNLEINAAPSSTLGDVLAGRGPGFFIYQIGSHEKGGIETSQFRFIRAVRAPLGSHLPSPIPSN